MSIFHAGLCAIPLSTGSTQAEIEYFLDDSQASLVMCSPKYAELVRGIPSAPNVLELTHDDLEANVSSGSAAAGGNDNMNEDALVVYTSGTTGKPKGVVHTHSSLQAQIQSLSEAWEWS